MILFVLVAGVLFAKNDYGIEWSYSESSSVTTLTNTTSGGLYIMVWLWNGTPYGSGYLASGETKKIPVHFGNIKANKININTTW
jgi:hypothetical protein